MTNENSIEATSGYTMLVVLFALIGIMIWGLIATFEDFPVVVQL
jgi:phosphate/sulfate permease